MAKSAVKASGQADRKASAQKSAPARKSGRKSGKANSQPAVISVVTLGDFALKLIDKQYRRLIKQEAGVLQDTDPEYLHQMRVSSRRLRTVLQLFDQVVELPKPAQAQQIQKLAKVLGGLRDLDVQLAALKQEYRPQVAADEQLQIDQAIERLKAQRQKTFKRVEQSLTASKYCDLKTAYEDWLDKPIYRPLAQLSLAAALPDLLTPLLSELLLHPGWWADCGADQDETILHELRKTCKHARYQSEFFAEFYGDEFGQWVEELKQLQEDLGLLQDAHVLLELLDLDPATAPDLFQLIQQQRQRALSNWDQLREKYTNATFRYSLYQMTLAPA